MTSSCISQISNHRINFRYYLLTPTLVFLHPASNYPPEQHFFSVLPLPTYIHFTHYLWSVVVPGVPPTDHISPSDNGSHCHTMNQLGDDTESVHIQVHHLLRGRRHTGGGWPWTPLLITQPLHIIRFQADRARKKKSTLFGGSIVFSCGQTELNELVNTCGSLPQK